MKTHIRVALIPSILAASVLSGCASTSGAKATGGGLLTSRSSTPANSGVYISSLQGGLIDRSKVASISSADRQRALEAEYRALEAAPGGQPVVWQGQGVSGSVVAAAPYQVGSQNCRQYSHTVTVQGRETVTRGAACRNAEGVWAPLT
ncbi:hypothetical protein [Sinorhizobium sp. BG8]|uniref:hypothetical protein n=1 Tax=Sinorhizobium sp. BG8 TaxID=2613773 RepID=UPI00193D00F9|nr:hypothetical protein [Sinorhizobium sp. BG8]QRM54767.1 hypothetical protein F3Y30_09585 [Sinorhizobium sp. BG8]